ncbi:MAG: hypothetical protein HY300_18560 [Verrucomicrobia bacterium]|nr:hypothetical protein [Verrucomicrobiota bacterium]
MDPKDYPRELATIIGDSLMDSASDFEIVKFSKTDNPEAVKALIALAESHPELWRENFKIAYTLARMTNSTNLIPALAGGLDSPTSIVVSSCHRALIQMPVLDTARAFVERAKTAEATIPSGWEFSRRDFLLESIQELRNAELIPYLRLELEKSTDTEVAKRLRRAIKGTELGWPPVAQEEDWRSIGLQ